MYQLHKIIINRLKSEKSGSGLPLDLPKQTAGLNIKLIPIVSSARAFNIIYRKWKQNYNKVPDSVTLEGPMACGHLGFSYNDIINDIKPTLEHLVKELVVFVDTLEESIPVIAAGGISVKTLINQLKGELSNSL